MRDILTGLLASAFVLFTFTRPAAAQDVRGRDAGKKVLTLDEYGRWSRITSTAISPNGRWMTFVYDPNEGDTVLRVKQIDGEAVYAAKGGGRPVFSADSRWCAFLVEPAEAVTEALRAAKKPVTRACEFIDLGNGKRRKIAAASSFTFAATAKFLAILTRRVDAKAKHRGADLLLVDLAKEGRPERNIGNVVEYAFNESGTLLAYLVDAEDKAGNGAYLLDLSTGRVGALDSSTERIYSQLSWDEKTDDVASLRGDAVKGFAERANSLVAFVDVAVDGGRRFRYRPSRDEGFPRGFALSEYRRPRWSEDGRRLFVGIRAQREKVGEPEKNAAGKQPAPRSNVEVWHWKDERLQSVQKIRAASDRRRTFLAVLHVGRRVRFVQLETDAMRSVTTSDHPRWAIGRDDSAYRGDMRAARGRSDYYRVDMATGERRRIVRSVHYGLGSSPDGEDFLYSVDGTVFDYGVATGDRRDLSEFAGVDFTNREMDRPSEKPSYGIAVFVPGGVLLNHEFDVWFVPTLAAPDRASRGRRRAPVNITRGVGARHRIRFRYLRLDPKERTIDPTVPLMLSAYGERTKKSGTTPCASVTILGCCVSSTSPSVHS